MADKPEDLALPIASVSRVINDALPANVNVSAETRKAIGRAASVFVLYTTATAASLAQNAGRKTMNANDVMDAIVNMDFPQFKDRLEHFLEAFRNNQKKKKESNTARKQSTGTDNRKSSKSKEDDAGDVQMDESNPIDISDSDDE